jgi:uncharacterized repeat protein (TIGR01451 family)
MNMISVQESGSAAIGTPTHSIEFMVRQYLAFSRRLLGLVLLCGVVGHAGAIQITTSNTVLYVGLAITPSPVGCGYAMISIANNDSVARSNLWVTIGSFTNPVVKLGGNDTGLYNLGSLAVNEAKPASFYLQATNGSGTSRYTITVYQGYPGIGTQLASADFPVTVTTVANGANNKVTACSYSPAQPVLGSLITLTVAGTTAPLTSGRLMAFTPATATNWVANAFRLETSSISNAAASATYSNVLSFVQTGSGKVDWTATYWIRAIGVTPTSSTPSPDGAFASGGSATIEDSGISVTLPAILPPTNAMVMTNYASVSQLYTNETVFFTNRVWNSGSSDVWLDRIVDTLPAGFLYVSNSTTFHGTSIANPNVSGATNTWSVPLLVPAGTSRDMVFQAIPTGTNTYVTNSAVAYIGNEVIDQTLDTANSLPATSTVRVLWEPHATNDTGTTLEDTPLPVSAPGVLSNDSEPNGFTMTVLSYTQPSHGGVTVNANGSYTYTPTANYNGSDSFSYTMTNGNARASTATMSLTVTAVNDPPIFTKGGDQTVLEDAGAQSVANWVTSISSGPSDESSQTVAFHVSNDNNSLFSAQPAISSAGTLTYTPAANANGSAMVSVYLQDNGLTANGGNDTGATQTFTITVTAVNDLPSFTKGGDQTVLEDAGAQSVANWATSISAGPANESSQTLTFHVSNNNTSLFSSQPAISSAGTLTYTPTANANGSATVSVYLQDSGDTSNGGSNTSGTQTFTITVTAVNDAPSFTKGADKGVLGDAGAQSVANWATSIIAGPGDESGQTLTFHVSNNNNGLFSSQPAISSSGTLTYTPSDSSNGVATVSVYLTDNGLTANGGSDTSATQTFTITLTQLGAKLAFTTQPASTNAGSTLAGVVVQIEDVDGDDAFSNNVPVTLTLNTGSFAAGTVTRNTDSTGKAAFNDLQINVAGSYALTAAASGIGVGLASANSSSFDITAATASVIRLETAADGSGTLVPAQSVSPNSSVTAYAISRDGYENFVANVAADAWSLPTRTGGVANGDLVAAGNGKSAIFTGHKAGTTAIRATSGALSPTDSGLLTVPNAAPVAGPASYQRKRNVSLRLLISNLLSNVTDANGDAISLTYVSASTNGAAVYTNSTYLLYSIPPGGNIADRFTYMATDGTASATGTVDIVMAPLPTGTNYNIVASGVTDGKPDLTFAGVPGVTYVVQVTSELSGTPTWTDKLTTNAPAGGLFRFVDPAPPSPAFYRAINP